MTDNTHNNTGTCIALHAQADFCSKHTWQAAAALPSQYNSYVIKSNKVL
jgi:hypothetical protein